MNLGNIQVHGVRGRQDEALKEVADFFQEEAEEAEYRKQRESDDIDALWMEELGLLDNSINSNKYPARELMALAFPDCAGKCLAIDYLGAGECEAVCPFKFTKDGKNLSQKEVWEKVFAESCVKATLPWWDKYKGVCKKHQLPQVPCPACMKEMAGE